MKLGPSIAIPAGVTLIAQSFASAADPEPNIDLPPFQPYGFQSGDFRTNTNNGDQMNIQQSELLNDDSFASSMYYDPQHNLIFFTGSTFGTYFDSATDLSSDIKAAMGMSSEEGGRDGDMPHLVNSDCFLGILKLPRANSPLLNGMSNPAPWLAHNDEDGQNKEPTLIYARRFGTPQSSEACSSILMLPGVNDALLQTSSQLKLAMLGHVNPTPLSSAEVNALGPPGGDYEPSIDDVQVGPYDGRTLQGYELEMDRLVRSASQQTIRGAHDSRQSGSGGQQQQKTGGESEKGRELQAAGNRGGFLHSISGAGPVTEGGRSYGFILDFDLSLTLDETFTTAPDDSTFQNAYGALLGGHVLESSPLVYPVAMAQNKRDPNQLYIVSLHSDNEEVILNPEYTTTTQEELDSSLHNRPDMTMGGAGGSGAKLVGGVPKYGNDFYVKVQQLTITPYEQLMDVEPTFDEKVKRTMTAGWGFGFKLNDADDVRPSTIVFVKGRTPNEDLLLLGGTTRQEENLDGRAELDGFITKLIPPAPTPVADLTTGATMEDAVEDEATHPTKRIDSTTGRDETVTAICLPPPDPVTAQITHAFVVGSESAIPGTDASLAYIYKIKLDDLSTVWKAHVPSIHPSGIGGDVLGEGCAVSPDGKMVFLSGTIDGGSALNTGLANVVVQPVGGTTDVFVVAFDNDFGNVQWAKQLGTVNEDKLARGGGITCDNEGNVIIMGSTRGELQRFRPDASGGRREMQGQRKQQQTSSRMASDVFVMSLSRTDGEYVNAPFSGGDVFVSASGGTASSPAATSTAPSHSGGGGLSAGGIVGIILMVIGVVAAALFFGAQYRKKSRIKRYNSAERMWNNSGADDFTFDNHSRNLAGRKNSWLDGRAKSPGGALRISRGADDDDDDDVRSTSSGSSRGSYKSKQQEDNSNFLASLREEANATMSKMVKGSEESYTADPRLDGGASIKSLLSHYREVKKGGLLEDDNVNNSGKDEGKNGGDGGSVKKGGSPFRKGKPPPPPPPRRKKNDESETAGLNTGDGLSEFTIV